jgi:hypothetical protein
MEIRRANRGDQVAIGNLISDWDRDNGQRYKKGRGRVSEREFVAEDADGIVGWISGQHDARVWQFLAAYEDQPDNWFCSTPIIAKPLARVLGELKVYFRQPVSAATLCTSFLPTHT